MWGGGGEERDDPSVFLLHSTTKPKTKSKHTNKQTKKNHTFHPQIHQYFIKPTKH